MSYLRALIFFALTLSVAYSQDPTPLGKTSDFARLMLDGVKLRDTCVINGVSCRIIDLSCEKASLLLREGINGKEIERMLDTPRVTWNNWVAKGRERSVGDYLRAIQRPGHTREDPRIYTSSRGFEAVQGKDNEYRHVFKVTIPELQAVPLNYAISGVGDANVRQIGLVEPVIFMFSIVVDLVSVDKIQTFYWGCFVNAFNPHVDRALPAIDSVLMPWRNIEFPQNPVLQMCEWKKWPLVAAMIRNHFKVPDSGSDAQNSLVQHGLTAGTRDGQWCVLEELVKLIWFKSAYRDEHGNTLLHRLVIHGQTEIALNLLSNKGGTLLDAVNNNGDTAAHIAARGQMWEIFNKLCERGANLDLENLQKISTRGIQLGGLFDSMNQVVKDSAQIPNFLKILNSFSGSKNSQGVISVAPYNPIVWAVNRNLPIIALALIEAGFDVAICDEKEGEFTPLEAAAIKGHFDVAKALLAKGALVNPREPGRGTGPLHMAVWGKNKQIRDLLLNQKTIDVNAKDGYQLTALHLGACLGDEDAVRALLAKGAAVDAVDQWGLTPLHYAVLNGTQVVVQILMEHGADFTIKSGTGKTVEDFLSLLQMDEGTTAVLNQLREMGAIQSQKAQSDEDALKQLQTAFEDQKRIRQENSDRMAGEQKKWLEKGRAPTIKKFPLHHAALEGDLPSIRYLLGDTYRGALDESFSEKVWRKAGFPRKIYGINDQGPGGNTALHYACSHGRINVVSELLKANAAWDIKNDQDETALNLAKRFCDKAVVSKIEKLLHDNQAQEKNEERILKLSKALEKRRTAFSSSSSSSIEEIRRLEMSAFELVSASVNVADYTIELSPLSGLHQSANITLHHDLLHTSLLAQAAEAGFGRVAEVLLNKGCKVNGNGGKSELCPLLAAVLKGHVEMARFLISRGANPKLLDNQCGRKPMGWLGSRGTQEMLEVLYAVDQDIDHKDNRGETLLHDACFMGNIEVAEWLLKKGANIDAKNAQGEQPIHIAIRFGELDVIPLLYLAGANMYSEDGQGRDCLNLAKQASSNNKKGPEILALVEKLMAPKKRKK